MPSAKRKLFAMEPDLEVSNDSISSSSNVNLQSSGNSAAVETVVSQVFGTNNDNGNEGVLGAFGQGLGKVENMQSSTSCCKNIDSTRCGPTSSENCPISYYSNNLTNKGSADGIQSEKSRCPLGILSPNRDVAEQ